MLISNQSNFNEIYMTPYRTVIMAGLLCVFLFTAKKEIKTYCTLFFAFLIETASQTTSISTRNCAIMRIPIPPTLNRIRKCLEKQAKDNSVEEYLTFLGFKANPYPYMNKADLIVQTSRWEGKSVVLDEAKILGKPILATDYATVKDQVENGKEGVIVEMDAESIAREIEHLVEDESVLNGIRNYLMARNYGNQSEIVKYYKLFDQ